MGEKEKEGRMINYLIGFAENRFLEKRVVGVNFNETGNSLKYLPFDMA